MSHPLPNLSPAPTPAAPGKEIWPRILGDIGDPTDGPTLIVIGGLHGNEPAGVKALQRFFARLEADGSSIAGRVIGLSGNRRALAMGRRFLSLDLNRIWRPERLQKVRSVQGGLQDEEAEMAALDAILAECIGLARGPACVVDLHTTSGPGPAFTVLHDTLMNRRFARALRIPLALGLEEELNGTLSDHLTDQGVIALTVETGQHDDHRSIDRAQAALWIVLDVAGLLPERYRRETEGARRQLERETRGLPAAVEVRFRHAIGAGGEYRTNPGFSSFGQVREGQIVGTQDGRPVSAPMSGLLLMPLYQEQGNDGFFVTRPIRSMWMSLSTLLRRMRVERILTRLPGIRAVEEKPGTLLVNRRVARWLALQLFHLLGYRRREHSRSHLVMERRVEPEL